MRFVFIGLTLLVRDVGDDVGAPSEQLHGISAIALLAITFAVLILIAVREVRNRRVSRGGTSGPGPGQQAIVQESGESTSKLNSAELSHRVQSAAVAKAAR